MPGYEIIEWNEDNFDVRSIPYTAQAYDAGKYAFVSDYARFKILYEHGGLYFDTDVEVIKPMDDIIASGPFMGFEINPAFPDRQGAVAPGLGLGANPKLDLYSEILDFYANQQFVNSDGSLNQTTIVSYTPEILVKHGLLTKSGIQTVAGINIYPSEYFNPLDDLTGRLTITPNTRSIHWFAKTWLNVSPWRTRLSRLFHVVFGKDALPRIKRIFKK